MATIVIRQVQESVQAAKDLAASIHEWRKANIDRYNATSWDNENDTNFKEQAVPEPHDIEQHKSLKELYQMGEDKIIVKGWCVPDTFFNAWAWLIYRREEVRIAVFHTTTPGQDHFQAQAKIDGVWTYLTELFDGTSMTSQTYGKNSDQTPDDPYMYMTLMEASNQQWNIFKLP